MKSEMLIMILFCAFSLMHEIRAQDMSTKLPTLEEVKKVWSAKYAYPSERFFALQGVFDALSTLPDEAEKINFDLVQEYLLSEILNVPVATLQDDDDNISTQVFWMGEYLRKVACWQSMRYATNRLMRIADKISQFQGLFDLSMTDALAFAHRVDHYVEYGTNSPPKTGLTLTGMSTQRPWFGPTGMRIAKIIDFRRTYNNNVKAMRSGTLCGFYCLITMRHRNDPWPDNPDATRALWAEFAKRAKATPDELHKL